MVAFAGHSGRAGWLLHSGEGEQGVETRPGEEAEAQLKEELGRQGAEAQPRRERPMWSKSFEQLSECTEV